MTAQENRAMALTLLSALLGVFVIGKLMLLELYWHSAAGTLMVVATAVAGTWGRRR